jgi:MerR family copper efflux transcriptional regulator
MDQKLTISRVAHQCGMSVPNIRFYEAQGIIPAPRRTDAGYRLYSPSDVRRLRLARRARLLGLSLPEVNDLVDRAFSSECGAYAQEILHLVVTQRERIDQQIAELQALRGELDTLEQDARLISAAVPAGLTVAECDRCLLMDGDSDEGGFCRCSATQQVIPLEPLVGERMNDQLAPDVIDALVCEVGERPADAPTIAEIVGSVMAVHREADSLVVEFDPTARKKVQAVLAAERQCCSTIGWQLEPEPGSRLRITARPLQLETLEAMFTPA